jgi:predicted nucleic acid-binding protein
MVLFDTNILVYANDERDSRKQQIAIRLLERHARAQTARLSIQVLHEFASALLNKLHLPSADVANRVRTYAGLFPVEEASPRKLLRALEIHAFCRISIWDALIVAAAESAGCDTILSEDLSPEQDYCGIHVENPFKK